MSYSEAQAARVRHALAGRKGIAEKEMFGGIAFLLGGNMCVGVHGEDLIVRIEPSTTAAMLKEPARSRSTSPVAPRWRAGSSSRRRDTEPRPPSRRGCHAGSGSPPRCRRNGRAGGGNRSCDSETTLRDSMVNPMGLSDYHTSLSIIYGI